MTKLSSSEGAKSILGDSNIIRVKGELEEAETVKKEEKSEALIKAKPTEIAGSEKHVVLTVSKDRAAPVLSLDDSIHEDDKSLAQDLHHLTSKVQNELNHLQLVQHQEHEQMLSQENLKLKNKVKELEEQKREKEMLEKTKKDEAEKKEKDR